MCGILGVINNLCRPDRGVFERGLRLLAHRGPDGEGIWERPGAQPPFVTLGHRRLAIIDLTAAAAQPMRSDDGQLCLTYNGEIYNYVELMEELKGRGYQFRSHCDTEVILHAYREWGEGCLQRFNGMFAFALWDESKRELFAARDRFGEKPFHYTWDPQTGFFAFASEIKALLGLPEISCAIDDRALYRYLVFEEQAGVEQTIWRGIKRLPHAHWLRWRWADGAGKLSVQRYWDIDLSCGSTLDLPQAAARFRELFADSVRLRLRSDVPVGSSLSGGLDSSAVVCQIHALGAAGGQKTFSARMEEKALDEGAYIEMVRQQTGLEGHEVWPSTAELQAVFSNLCYHLEEPFCSTSQFAQHLVMRLARDNGVTVLLDGQGADELLAGYTPYFHVRYRGLAEEGSFWALAQEWRGFKLRQNRAFPFSWSQAAADFLPGVSMLRRLKSKTTRNDQSRTLPGSAASSWCNPDWLMSFRDEPAPELPASSRDRLTRKLYADSMRGELQELLRYGDRNSMAWSREVRQPFLDHRIAELLFTLPPKFKMLHGETKVVLRHAIKGLIPDEVLRRQDKLGYQAPLPTWMSGSMATWTEEHLDSLPQCLGGRIRGDAIGRFRSMRADLNESRARGIFTMVTLGESLRRLTALAANKPRA